MNDLQKPSRQKRMSLVVAGESSGDPLDVMNDFYRAPETTRMEVHSQYWQTMVAVLCERVCRAEKSVKELRAELFNTVNRLDITEEWLLNVGWQRGAKRTFERDVDGLSVSIWRSSSGPWWNVALEEIDIPVSFTTRNKLLMFLRGVSEDGECQCHDYELANDLESAVCRNCGKSDSVDVLSFPPEQR